MSSGGMIREVVVDGVMSFLFVEEGGSGAGCGGGAEAVEAGFAHCRIPEDSGRIWFFG